MRTAKIVENTNIGLWEVLNLAFTRSNNNYWRCQCGRCGAIKVYLESFLSSGRIPVCICRPGSTMVSTFTKEKKALQRALYREWSELKRKFNPNDRLYKNWGELGIMLCDDWYDFLRFKRDMEQKYSLGDKLYIKDVPKLARNKGVISKESCIWVDTKIRQPSIRNLYVNYRGKEVHLLEIYNKYNKDLDYETVYQRIVRKNRRWPVMKALKTPKIRNNKPKGAKK